MSARTAACPGGSRYRRASGPAAGSSTSSSPLAAWCSSHSRIYRSVVPVREASSAEVAGPSAFRAWYRPSRSPRYTVSSSSAPTMSRNSRPLSAAGSPSSLCADRCSSAPMPPKLQSPEDNRPRPEAGAASHRRVRRRLLKWDRRRLRLPERCLGRRHSGSAESFQIGYDWGEDDAPQLGEPQPVILTVTDDGEVAWPDHVIATRFDAAEGSSTSIAVPPSGSSALLVGRRHAFTPVRPRHW